MKVNYKLLAFILGVTITLISQTAMAAKLTPISRTQANGDIAACKATPGHFILGYGDWTACCVEDANLKVTCTVCDKQENCSTYSELKGPIEIFNLMKLAPAINLAPAEPAQPTGPAEPREPLIHIIPRLNAPVND